MKKPLPSGQPTLFEAEEPASNSPADVGWNAQSTARPPLLFQIPPGTPASRCRSCSATVFWIVTPRGRKMPLDGDGTSHFVSCPQAAQHRRPR